MKNKTIFLALSFAFILSFINLNIYSYKTNLNTSKFSFAPSLGIEKSHAGGVVSAISDAVSSIGNIVGGVVGAIVNTATGLLGASLGAINALISGGSLLEGWNCGYYDGSSWVSGQSSEFFGGGTCGGSDGVGVYGTIYVCKSDNKAVSDPNSCSSLTASCSNGVTFSYYPDRGEKKPNCPPNVYVK